MILGALIGVTFFAVLLLVDPWLALFVFASSTALIGAWFWWQAIGSALDRLQDDDDPSEAHPLRCGGDPALARFPRVSDARVGRTRRGRACRSSVARHMKGNHLR